MAGCLECWLGALSFLAFKIFLTPSQKPHKSSYYHWIYYLKQSELREEPNKQNYKILNKVGYVKNLFVYQLIDFMERIHTLWDTRHLEKDEDIWGTQMTSHYEHIKTTLDFSELNLLPRSCPHAFNSGHMLALWLSVMSSSFLKTSTSFFYVWVPGHPSSDSGAHFPPSHCTLFKGTLGNPLPMLLNIRFQSQISL